MLVTFAHWCSGSTEDFGSFSRGSNPRWAVLKCLFSLPCGVIGSTTAFDSVNFSSNLNKAILLGR